VIPWGILTTEELEMLSVEGWIALPRLRDVLRVGAGSSLPQFGSIKQMSIVSTNTFWQILFNTRHSFRAKHDSQTVQ
jgi:hypothetical protein